MKHSIALLVMAFLISACGASEALPAPNLVIASVTALPTVTETSTATVMPTITSTPTNTATATVTNTSTPLPPATLTQIALEATQTEQANLATAAQLAVEATRTERANFATATQEARNKVATSTAIVRTQTAQAKAATATEIASYQTIYWKELATYPQNYVNEKVMVRGRVFNVIGQVVQIYFAGTYEPLYVIMRDDFTGLYEDDYITVYGRVKGKECFKNAYGAEICQPALHKAWFTKP